MTLNRNSLLCALVGAGCLATGLRGAVNDPSAPSLLPPVNLSLVDPIYAAVPPSPSGAAAPAAVVRGPLMSALDSVGVGQYLESAHINVYGHIEGSYTYNFNNPAKDLNLGRVFDINDNRPQVNQLDLNVEKIVDLTTHQFDVGGRLEMLYGTDARFIHANGFLDHQGNDEYQFDIPQVYVDLAIPVGEGLRLRVGKFLFFKQIDPNASVFYSHSFTFGAALPFTLSGITAMYNFGDQWSVEGGISRGWGQSLKDNNGAIDALARVRYSPTDRTTITLAAITGPEDTGDNSHYRTTLDLTVSQLVGDQLTLLLDTVYGTDAAGAPNGNANWYGVAGYAVYKLNNYVSLGGRLEWYRDEEGFTTAVAQTLYEATLGVTVTPFPNDSIGANLKLRPEVRYDYSSRDFFDGLSRHDQTTVAIDAIFNF